MISSLTLTLNDFRYKLNVGKLFKQKISRIIFLPIKAACKLTQTRFLSWEERAKIILSKVAKSSNYLLTQKMIHIALSLTTLKCSVWRKDSGIVKPLLIITNFQFCKMSPKRKTQKIFILTGEESYSLIASANKLRLIDSKHLIFNFLFNVS